MSRYKIPNAPGSPDGRETTVGWDAPLNTYFAMAFDPPPSGDEFDDEIEVFWVGGMPTEIAHVQDLAEVLREHGVVFPPDVADQLLKDKTGEGDQSQGRPASALMEAMRSGEDRACLVPCVQHGDHYADECAGEAR